jgi:hypothetical protein
MLWSLILLLQPLGKGVFTFTNGCTQQGEFVVDEDESARSEEQQGPSKTKWAGQSVGAQ